MSDKTAIEWTDATWNPTTGCTKVSAGCKHCYAEREWPRLAAPRAKPNRYTGRAFTDVQEHLDALEQPLRWTKPRRIFVNSMSDLFHPDVSDQFIGDVFAYMAYARQHTFQTLTKRPERMCALLNDPDWIESCYEESVEIAHEAACEILGRRGEFDANARRSDDIRAFNPSLPLANVHLGISAEDQQTYDERSALLRQTPAAVRWVSAEPLLAQINLRFGVHHHPDNDWRDPAVQELVRVARRSMGSTIDWIVAGGESGPQARPTHPDWVRSLRDQCAAAGVPFLFKQWGEWGFLHGGGLTREVQPVLANCRVIGDTVAWRVGKKFSGRLLDGVLHDAYPA